MHPTEKIAMHRGKRYHTNLDRPKPEKRNVYTPLPSFLSPHLLHPKHGSRRYAENETYRTSDIRLSYRIG